MSNDGQPAARRRVFAGAVTCLLALASAANAQPPYTFVNVADSSGPLSPSFGLPVINDAGVVAFYAQADGGGEGIVRGTPGGAVPFLARSGSGGFTGNFSAFNAINDAGTVAFHASRGAPVSLYTRTDPASPPTLITDGGGEFGINNAGTVAFANSTGVFIGDGGAVRAIHQAPAPTPENPQPFRLDGYPAINDAGTVVFAGMIDNRTGIYVGDGSGPVRLLVGTDGPVGLSQGLALNNAGQVATSAFKTTGGMGIFVVEPDGRVSMIADDTGPYQALYSASLNDGGEVVFRASLDNGAGDGLFTGPDPVADKVIQFGDTLFGSPVNSLDVFRDSVNDAGTIAFLYGTANGRRGIAVAIVPEPGGALAALGLACAVLARRRREGRDSR